MEMAEKDISRPAVKVVDSAPLSPHAKALYEAGKMMLVDSIEIGRDFCKSMIGISTSAIPVYLGIVAFIIPEEYQLGIPAGIIIAVPAIGFLAAALLFVAGYLPRSGTLSLNDPDEIDRERARLMNHRWFWIRAGSWAFFLSMAGAIGAIVNNIGAR
jgi:hypothetical protein